MAIKVGAIVIHCFEFEAMVKFWQEALDYRPRRPASGGWVTLIDPEGRGPSLSFQRRERKRGRRNWIHLDLYAGSKQDQAAEVERLTGLGAKEYPWRYPPRADYVVLEDPDGNLFCVIGH
jgi:Glyoxalase-like domain